MPRKINLPDKAPDIIKDVLKKNDLWEEENFEKFLEDPEKYQETLEESSGYKLSNLINRCAEGEISLEELPSLIKKELDISKQKANKISKELEEKILRIEEIEEVAPASGGIKPKKPDIYREPIQ